MTEKLDTELRTKGVFEEGGQTPLYQFATQDLQLRGPTTGELLQESGKITERRATRMEESAKSLKAKADEAATLAAKQAEERKTERPPSYELPAAPDLTARPFLSPPQSVLGQLQTALVGIGQIAQGIGGLKGKGYAIGATAALKGALEGWQAGDAERVKRAFEQWQVDSQRLLAAHRSRRERYQDILDDQTRTMQDRLSQIGLEAQIAGLQDLADAARSGEITKVLDIFERGQDRELQSKKLDAQLLNWFNTQRHQQLMEGLAISREKRETGRDVRQEAKEKEKEDKAIRQERVTMIGLDQILRLVPTLQGKGLLMDEPGFTSWLSVEGQRRVFQKGDPDLDTFRSHVSTVVRTARALGDIGFRAWAAIGPVADLLEHATTAEAVTKAVTQLKNLVALQMPARVRRTVEAFNTATDQRVRVILEPGETLEDVLTQHPELDFAR